MQGRARPPLDCLDPHAAAPVPQGVLDQVRKGLFDPVPVDERNQAGSRGDVDRALPASAARRANRVAIVSRTVATGTRVSEAQRSGVGAGKQEQVVGELRRAGRSPRRRNGSAATSACADSGSSSASSISVFSSARSPKLMARVSRRAFARVRRLPRAARRQSLSLPPRRAISSADCGTGEAASETGSGDRGRSLAHSARRDARLPQRADSHRARRGGSAIGPPISSWVFRSPRAVSRGSSDVPTTTTSRRSLGAVSGTASRRSGWSPRTDGKKAVPLSARASCGRVRSGLLWRPGVASRNGSLPYRAPGNAPAPGKSARVAQVRCVGLLDEGASTSAGTCLQALVDLVRSSAEPSRT